MCLFLILSRRIPAATVAVAAHLTLVLGVTVLPTVVATTVAVTVAVIIAVSNQGMKL